MKIYSSACYLLVFIQFSYQYSVVYKRIILLKSDTNNVPKLISNILHNRSLSYFTVYTCASRHTKV